MWTAIRCASSAVGLYACAWFCALVFLPPVTEAQDEQEPPLSVNGLVKLQGGVFVPLASSKFAPHRSLALTQGIGTRGAAPLPCDPRVATTTCLPVDHGQEPGTASIARATLQLEGHWSISEQLSMHTIVRAVRSLRLSADRYAQIPEPDVASWGLAQASGDLQSAYYDQMGEYAERWVHERYYSELDLRELYLDVNPSDWLSMRIGRQLVMWGEIGGYRLLDAVNPDNNTWHFGALEAPEDTRIPLWMWLTTLDLAAIEHSLELLWIPMIDRPRDTVTVPLTFVGAWGLPYPDTPTPFFTQRKHFSYPGGAFKDMRAGLRWKGALGRSTNYSLVYLYTHQFSPPVPLYFDYAALRDMNGAAILDAEGRPTPDSERLERAVVIFPRQHLAGFSVERALGLSTVRVEAAVEPNRTFTGKTDYFTADPGGDAFRQWFLRKQKLALNYALALQHPAMIRFLNPSQKFLFIAQFFHSYVPGLEMEDPDDKLLTQVPGYNNWQAQRHSFRVAFATRTSYLHGLINVNLSGAYLPNLYAGDSGFYSIDLGFRIGPHYRLSITATDFLGKDPYRDLGLYRDRDEVAVGLSVLF